MKIKRIRFQNLNSLTGIWEIDFTSPAYTGNNLFAITGPTGAGKSTLLDALCLALYGTTPRLGKITKTSNQIMSRHTGACFAEVEFSTTKGSFRCHWSQHRSHQKALGELQPPKHEITNSVTDKLLESRIRNVANKVEEVTGMDFERFTRSTLLAQGGFAAFLQASADKRAPILEQITGTEIYSRLSIKVHELRLVEQNKLEDLEQTLSHINLLSPENEEELKKQIIEANCKIEKNKTQLSTLQQYLAWIQNIAKLEREHKQYIDQLEILEKEKKEQHNNLSSLQPALTAKEIEPLHNVLLQLNESRQQSIKELETHSKTYLSLEKSKQVITAQTEVAVKDLQKSEELQKKGIETIRRVEKLDHSLQDSGKSLQEQSNRLSSAQKTLEKELSILEGLVKQRFQLQNDKNGLEKFFKAHTVDENLAEEFGAIKSIINRLIEIYPEYETIQKANIQIIQELQSKNNLLKTLTNSKDKAQDALTLTIESGAEIQKNIKQFCHGEDSSDLQRKLFKTQNRVKSIHELIQLLQQLKDKTELIKNLHLQFETIVVQTEEKAQILSNRIKEQNTIQQEITLLEKNLLLLARIQTLEEDREQLLDGTPCPLCGSLSHPYNNDTIPTSSKERIELEQSQAELKIVNEHIIAGKQEEAISIERKFSLNSKIEETDLKIKKIQKEAEQLLSTLDLPLLTETQLDQIEQELHNTIEQTNALESTLSQHEKLTKSFKQVKNQTKELTIIAQNLEKEFTTAQHSMASVAKDREILIKQEKKLCSELEVLEDEISQKLQPYGHFEVAEKNLSSIILTLEQRITVWKEKKEEERRINPEFIKLDAEHAHKQTFCTKEGIQIAEQVNLCAISQKHFNELQMERKSLFGNKNTREEEIKLSQSVSNHRDIHTKSLVQHGEVEKEITAVNTLQNHLTNEIKVQSEKITTQQVVFDKAISDSIFATCNDFLEAMRTPQQLKELQELQNKLLQRESELTTLIKQKSADLQLEKEKRLFKGTKTEIEEQLSDQEKQLEISQKETITAQEQLRSNDQDKSKHSKQLKVVTVQKNTISTWNKLHMLIGSADGKKFRNFAQGLTFEMMIHHANSHLRKMDNRYILIRDKTQPLDLNVIDTYQADEIRSTKNLSGGESFLVSLALALGLSRMASHNVRVDSLFLDEGFGTLDENALESALETLAQLREENKLIGIISHVGALKERVPLQIKIIPGSRGNSTITGPGVTREG